MKDSLTSPDEWRCVSVSSS